MLEKTVSERRVSSAKATRWEHVCCAGGRGGDQCVVEPSEKESDTVREIARGHKIKDFVGCNKDFRFYS